MVYSMKYRAYSRDVSLSRGAILGSHFLDSLSNLFTFLTTSRWRCSSRCFLRRAVRSARSALPALPASFILLCPRLRLCTQSTLNWSHCLLGCPDTKCLPHTRSFSNFSAVRSALLMAEIHCLRLVDVSPSTCSPWLVITRGTRNNLNFSRCVCALPVLVPHPTMRHSTIITRH